MDNHNHHLAQTMMALIKQVSMLRSYIDLKNGQEFKDYCKKWMHSDCGQQYPPINVFQFQAKANSIRNVGVKRKVADSGIDTGDQPNRQNIQGAGTSNSSNVPQSPTTKSEQETRKKMKISDFVLDHKNKNQIFLVRDDPHQHYEHGVRYMLYEGGVGVKLVYNSYVYMHRNLQNKDRMYWRCDCKKMYHGGCKADLAQDLDGRVISVEEHIHPKPGLVVSEITGTPLYRNGKRPKLNTANTNGRLRIGNVSDMEDSDSTPNSSIDQSSGKKSMLEEDKRQKRKMNREVTEVRNCKKVAADRHRDQGVRYMYLSNQKEKLVYNSYVYSLDKDEGRRYWSCDNKYGGCTANLVQDPDGGIISVEEHFHPKATLFTSKRGNLLYENQKNNKNNTKAHSSTMEKGLRICSVSEVDDSDSSSDVNDNFNSTKSKTQDVRSSKPTESESGLVIDSIDHNNMNVPVDIKVKTEPVDADIKIKTEPMK